MSLGVVEETSGVTFRRTPKKDPADETEDFPTETERLQVLPFSLTEPTRDVKEKDTLR